MAPNKFKIGTVFMYDVMDEDGKSSEHKMAQTVTDIKHDMVYSEWGNRQNSFRKSSEYAADCVLISQPEKK